MTSLIVRRVRRYKDVKKYFFYMSRLFILIAESEASPFLIIFLIVYK